MRELNELEKNPPEGIRVQTSDEDMLDVTGIIEGPGALFIMLILTSMEANAFLFNFKRVHPMRVDISESSSNLLKNFLLHHLNVRHSIFDTLPVEL